MNALLYYYSATIIDAQNLSILLHEDDFGLSGAISCATVEFHTPKNN
jgi:hypothetical protein